VSLFARVIAPSLGIFLSNVMWCSPAFAILAARKDKTLGQLNLLPFVMMVFCTFGWTLYGSMKADPYILWSNIPGMALGFWCSHSIAGILSAQIAVHEAGLGQSTSRGGLGLAENESLVGLDVVDQTADVGKGDPSGEGSASGSGSGTSRDAKATTDVGEEKKGAEGEAEAGAAPTAIDTLKSQAFFIETAMWIAPLLWGLMAQLAWVTYVDVEDKDTALHIVGNACIAQTVIYFGAPLSQALEVIRRKDSSSIYPPMVITNTAACLMWTIYGFSAVDDIAIWGPNVAGIVLQILNMILCLVYKNTHWAILGACGSSHGQSSSTSPKLEARSTSSGEEKANTNTDKDNKL